MAYLYGHPEQIRHQCLAIDEAHRQEDEQNRRASGTIREVPAILLRWSDETDWKPVEPYDLENGPAEEQMDRCRKMDASCQARYGHKFHAEFRIGTAMWDTKRGRFV